MSVAPRVLVTAAGGWIGTPAVEELLRRGLRVRAILRRNDHRAVRMRTAGAEVVVGSVNDHTVLTEALRDVQRALLIMPISPMSLDAAITFGAVAETTGLETVVTLSQWLASPTSPSVHTRRAWLIDRAMSWLPETASVVLEPGFFAANYLEALPAAALTGVFPVPFGLGRNAPPSNEDIASVAAAVLADPGPHLGRRYRPTGPELLDPAEMAAILSAVLGRRVVHRDVPFAVFARFAKAAGFDDFAVAQTRWYAQEAARGTFEIGAPTSVVPDLVGRPAESFATIATRAAQRLPAATGLARARLGAMLLAGAASARRLPLRSYHAAFDNRDGESRELSIDSRFWLDHHEAETERNSIRSGRADPAVV